MMCDLYQPPVVLDCGTGYTKLGFAGNAQVVSWAVTMTTAITHLNALTPHSPALSSPPLWDSHHNKALGSSRALQAVQHPQAVACGIVWEKKQS